jgi:hypothetical protein
LEIKLEKSIIDHLSSRGVLAYVAVKMADGAKATTAVLASLVHAQTSVMREGLQELSLAAPGLLMRERNTWVCGTVEAGQGEIVQISESSDRYRSFVDDLKLYWEAVNRDRSRDVEEYLGPPFSMGAKDGSTIRGFLVDNPEWTQAQWRLALHNRAISVVKFQNDSRTAPLYSWVRMLAKYSGNVLDRFGKPVDGGSEKHGKVTSIHQGNREAGDEFIAGVRARTGTQSRSH